MTRLHDLAAAGTSPWLDNIRRSWLESGVFRRKVDDGIVGVTSNPTIFQKAIADSSDYDEAIRATHGESAQDVFFELAIKDVQDAADQLKRRLRGHRSPRRLRLVRAAARPGQRRGRVDRRRSGLLEAHRAAQHLHQDPGHRPRA